VADQKKQAGELMAHPQQLNKMAFEQGIGFVPYGDVGLQAVHEKQAAQGAFLDAVGLGSRLVQ